MQAASDAASGTRNRCFPTSAGPALACSGQVCAHSRLDQMMFRVANVESLKSRALPGRMCQCRLCVRLLNDACQPFMS